MKSAVIYTVKRYVGFNAGTRKIPYRVLELAGIRFVCPHRMLREVATAIRYARNRDWAGMWMSQDRSGEINAYCDKPNIINPGRPSMQSWNTKCGFVTVSVNPIPNADEAEGWQDSLVRDVAGFHDALVDYNRNINREAETILYSFMQRHPFAVAMTKRARRRA